MDSTSETTTLVLRAREEQGIRRRGEPVTIGVPLPRGRVREGRELLLTDGEGNLCPLQTAIVDRWSGGTARWAHLDFTVDVEAGTEVEMRLHTTGPPDSGVGAPGTLRLDETERGWFVDTGAAQFTIDRREFLPFQSVRSGGLELLEPARSRWSAIDADGDRWIPRVRGAALEVEGPLRSTILLTGVFGRERSRGRERPLLDFAARLSFFAGSGSCRATITVRNPRRAKHAGGHWHLGDEGSILLEDLSLEFGCRRAPVVSWSTRPNAPLAEAPDGGVEIYQDSSGGENWRSRIHLDRTGSIPVSFCGYRLRTGGVQRTGRRATPRIAVHDGNAGVSASMRHFWQNFPKAMEARDGVLTVRLFPRQFGGLHEIQGGEQKTHDLVLTFGEAATAPEPDAHRAPLLFRLDPDWCEASGAIPYLTARHRDRNGLYLRLVDQAIEGPDAFESKREEADEYGWRNFGETWADHEARYWEGEGTFISHANNQYDVVYGALVQFLRSGDPRWFRIHEELARHVIDIDIYHTHEDRAAYNQGLFWHTAHYIDGDTSTHRTYPKGSVGGGPDDEHNYTTGLMHYWFLTADPLGREAAIGCARWVIDADDGARTVFRWIDRGRTGLASKTRELHYHGPGRGAGNSINALLNGWRLTEDETYLEKCHEILRRTIHPEDDLEARRLLDAEERWSYTVHLQSLGRFLDDAAEAARADELYAYARAALLHYARWMAEHERPILDAADALEYPNETWAAQDVRKSDVFKFAALHSEGEERERFLERGEFFFRHSLETLDGFDTKSYTRPVSILMHYGIMQSWFDHHPDDARTPPPPVETFGDPVEFVPQRSRAVKKLKVLTGAIGALVIAGIVAGRVLLR